MSTKIETILAAKNSAGDAYLWLHTSGDCILWESEAESQNDDGSKALERWSLTSEEVEELIATGAPDEVA